MSCAKFFALTRSKLIFWHCTGYPGIAGLTRSVQGFFMADKRELVTSSILLEGHAAQRSSRRCQLPELWTEIMGEATIADAISEQPVNSSHRIDIKRGSFKRNTQAPITEKICTIDRSFKVVPLLQNHWHGQTEIANKS